LDFITTSSTPIPTYLYDKVAMVATVTATALESPTLVVAVVAAIVVAVVVAVAAVIACCCCSRCWQ